MRKLKLFMHVSLDGLVAGPKGEMDWIHVDEEIFDYVAGETDKSDTALYGRVTYQMMEAYWPTAADKPNASKHDKHHSSWYNKVAKIVLSKTMEEHKIDNTTFIGDNLAQEIMSIKEKPGNDIIIFGSPSAAHSLMAEDLIDDYWLFINPVLRAEGTPLFKNINGLTQLNLLVSHTFSSGVICLHYQKK